MYVIKSSARGVYDASEVIELAASQFHAVTPELVGRLRRDWRRTTMEVLHAKLRVRELYEAQQQVGTFAVEQARSLVLTLGLPRGGEGAPTISEAEVVDALSRILPEEETAVVVSFLRSTATAAEDDALGRPPSAHGGGEDQPSPAGRASPFSLRLYRSQVAVGTAVLCDGAVDARLALCFDAFDALGCGTIDARQLVMLLHAIYRTYYKQPPGDAEVRTVAEVIFINVAGSPRGEPLRGDTGASEATNAPKMLARDDFLRLAILQPTLVQCFAKRGNRPLLTPRGVSQREKLPPEPFSALEAIVPLLLPRYALHGMQPIAPWLE